MSAVPAFQPDLAPRSRTGAVCDLFRALMFELEHGPQPDPLGARRWRHAIDELCAREVRDGIVAPALAIAERNAEFSDERVLNLLLMTLGRRITSPPALAAGAAPRDVARRDAAWTRELQRARLFVTRPRR